ncbi:MAG: pyrroline-5-carboxylate reductase [bacterium]
MKIAVLGVGKLGKALVSSLLDAKVVSPSDLVATAKHEERVKLISDKYGIPATTDNKEAVSSADTVLICTKPQTVGEVLTDIKSSVDESALIISAAASVPIEFIEAGLDKPVPVIRAMPNMPCLIRKGMTALCLGTFADRSHLEKADGIFRQVGRVLVVDEKHMNAVTGLSASGPAFIYVVIESMAEGGVKAGLPRSVATELAAQAVLGGASMVLETGEHPALLKDAVTTPAGCTIDGLMELEEGGLRVTLIKSVVKATERASELIDNN